MRLPYDLYTPVEYELLSVGPMTTTTCPSCLSPRWRSAGGSSS